MTYLEFANGYQWTPDIASRQKNRPTLEWLFSQGWNLREAADHLKVSPGHLSRVLKGDRESESLMSSVAALPQKKLVLRRRLKKEKNA